MPEMDIGFFPDIGASYFLNQMSKYIYEFLELTGEVIKPEDVLFIQDADYFISKRAGGIYLKIFAMRRGV